ncbi:MAG: 1-deoxy-D-xylulose-5-phosphate synthase [Cellulosilyticaceae bacterium]
MLKTLSKIKDVSDIKALEIPALQDLAKDVRKFLVQSVAKTGGHLASNLGVVEMTIALHYVFDSPQDKIVWDVGHQAYVHKLLTGRRKGFKTLRQTDGMSGFPKRHESEHDIFETGHSSTSISAALGLAVARDLKGQDNHVIAVIGDGALTGGMAFEALNNAGKGNHNLIVILNDNEMSISENVGGLCQYLSKLRSNKEYLQVKEDVEEILQHVPVLGDSLVDTVRRTKEGVKTFLMQSTLFEQMGFTYLGPIDGHSMDDLIHILENAKNIRGPVLIHLKTQKGKGYRMAELNPSNYHGVAPFDVKEGIVSKSKGSNTFSEAFGEAMVSIGDEYPEVVGITAAMREGTGLLPFSKEYPKRFFDVGIAEQHGVTFAAGLAMDGFRPVVAIYSSFLQRAYDQILHDVALQNLPVIFGVDRAGIVGEDGSTHQGIFDIAYLAHIPNMTILSPKVPEEMEGAMRYALSQSGPVAIRYPRGGAKVDASYRCDYTNPGLRILEKGEDAVMVTTGRMVETAFEVRALLAEQGVSLGIVEAPCIYPLDTEGLDALGADYDKVFTLEDHVLTDGFGALITQYLANQGIVPSVLHSFGYKTGIVIHGDLKAVLQREGLDPVSLANSILLTIRRED